MVQRLGYRTLQMKRTGPRSRVYPTNPHMEMTQVAVDHYSGIMVILIMIIVLRSRRQTLRPLGRSHGRNRNNNA